MRELRVRRSPIARGLRSSLDGVNCGSSSYCCICIDVLVTFACDGPRSLYLWTNSADLSQCRVFACPVCMDSECCMYACGIRRRATSPYKAIQPRFPAGRRRGAGGGLRPFIYVKALRKFGLKFRLQVCFLDLRPNPALMQLY